MKQPVVFLIYANQADSPLPDLSEEDRLIYEALAPVANEEQLFIHREQYATASKIIWSLGEFNKRVSIFHFGGHASNANLYLVGETASDKGLAQMLGLQKPLRLVFLNGCNTGGFIQELLDQGVPAIIATSREVNDKVALKLAQQFYKALSEGSTIGEAFDFAKGAVETDDTITTKIGRGIVLPATTGKDFPWGLYSKKPEALDWKIADAKKDVNPLPPYFWPRFAIIVSSIILVYIWSFIHFGFESLTMILTIALALSGIVVFFIKFYKNKFPGIHTGLESLQGLTLKPWFIGSLGFIILGIIAFISSVQINHANISSLTANLKTTNGDKATFFNIGSAKDNKTTLMAFINPVSRSHQLDIEGFEPLNIHYDWILGARLNSDTLTSNPAILVRLHQRHIPLKNLRKIRVIYDNKNYYFKPDSIPPSILFSDHEIQIPGNVELTWKDELVFENEAVKKEVMNYWHNYEIIDSLEPFDVGKPLKIELLNKKDEILSDTSIASIQKGITYVLLNN